MIRPLLLLFLLNGITLNAQVVTWGDSNYGGDSSSVASQLSSGVIDIYSNGSAFAAIKQPDTDGDGVYDFEDEFPDDPSETTDTDDDGVGDNADTFPNDPTEIADTDDDGVGDNADAFPSDPSETVDSDGDGAGDNSDEFPAIPTQDLVNAIKSNPTRYNLYSIDDIKDLRPGSTMIEVSGNQATVQLQMEESSDLQSWQDTGDPTTMTIPADTDTKFFRFKMAD